MRIIPISLGLSIGLIIGACHHSEHIVANEKRCDVLYFGKEKPLISNSEIKSNSREICFDAFDIIYDQKNHLALWSAEHLTSSQVDSARHNRRHNSFHAEELLSPSDRAELEDYKDNDQNLDRGHLSPSGDMPNSHAQFQSFSLANMIPQNADNNRGIWEGIESATRDLADSLGEVYIITGPIFTENSPKLNARIPIPQQIFKAIWLPKVQEGAVYLTNNAPGMKYQVISIAKLEGQLGINLFPKLSSELKNKVAVLPSPRPHHYRKNIKSPVDSIPEQLGEDLVPSQENSLQPQIRSSKSYLFK